MGCQHCVQSDSKTPDVDKFRVIDFLFQYLRSCVGGGPADSLSKLILRAIAAEAKVDEFDFAIFVKKNIFWFNVAMANLLMPEID